jgi:hypothetical protein|tara:strand:- start:2643 stop:2819 length:177 start_codon:yes stop_codon:yes gene_type:complete
MKELRFSNLFIYATTSERSLITPDNYADEYGYFFNTYTADVLSTSDYYPFGSPMPDFK